MTSAGLKVGSEGGEAPPGRIEKLLFGCSNLGEGVRAVSDMFYNVFGTCPVALHPLPRNGAGILFSRFAQVIQRGVPISGATLSIFGVDAGVIFEW